MKSKLIISTTFYCWHLHSTLKRRIGHSFSGLKETAHRLKQVFCVPGLKPALKYFGLPTLESASVDPLLKMVKPIYWTEMISTVIT